MSALTIVMYHYVRDLRLSRYPEVKALEVEAFRRQLDHLQEAYTVIEMEDVHQAVRHGGALPSNAALLTFDDGYIDHYVTVFPILRERGLQGSFFAPVAPVADRRLLDVNRVHFILASASSASELGESIDDILRSDGADAARLVSAYRAQWAKASRFDDAETIYVKRMLQTALPKQQRSEIAQELFARYVGVDESVFANELYLSADQARTMIDGGMHFGSHGATHIWLNEADPRTQRDEIDTSLGFLEELGVPVAAGWTMCYPYGAWNDDLLAILRHRGAAVGVTTQVGAASLGVHDPLLLPRLDTNDLPQ